MGQRITERRMHQATFEDAGQQGERPQRERDPAMRQTRKGQ